jgi:hypothetical protein
MAFAIPFKLIEAYSGALLTTRIYIFEKLKLVSLVTIINIISIHFVIIFWGIRGAAFLYVLSEIFLSLIYIFKIKNWSRVIKH